ncbi:MAG: TRAP transporter substrate-binding protein [Lachnospiraceae bacterium]|jgi:tripartite ATP-independent transporter DctP family solute receptor|nr:TRAP transporter substrate-binding protein [Lachnospiraceae bacterium]
MKTHTTQGFLTGFLPHKKCASIAILCLAMLLSAALSGCGDGSALQEGEQRYAWPLGTASPEDTVTQIYAEAFAGEVARLSDGKMKIQVYPNSTLGGDRELLESCRDGDIPFVIQNTAPQVAFLPDLAIFDMPCMFGTMEEVRRKVDDAGFYSLMETAYQEGGYKLLGFADQGFRVMSTNKGIQSLSDFKGQKIRTMENPYHIEFWKGLMAAPTPMTFSEVYIGLQQGTIDAQENPYEVIVSNRLYEQQDYVVETNHLPHLISLVASGSFFQDLPKEKQEILADAAKYASEEARKASDGRILGKMGEITSSGTQIVPVGEELWEEMQKASQPVYDEIAETVNPEIVKAYKE